MKRRKLPADRAVGTPNLHKKPHAGPGALALAAALVLGFPASDAQALALGRVTVQSALGEPLRADIDIPEITPEEAASLRVVVASPEAFRSAGMEYSPALSSVQISLQRRGDGRYFLRLTSERVVNDPFIDLILETNWSSGRIVRDYTMLFDPPSMRRPAQPLTAQVTPAPASPPPPAAVPAAPRSAPARPLASAPAPAAPRASAEVPPSRAPTPRPPVAAAAPTAPAPVAPPASAASATAATPDARRVTVQAGDTASRIANANRPATISLDQMLVALLQANPDAFMGGNINRLRAGAVLEVPDARQAGGTSPAEASRMVIAQSRDFNEFRRRLAEGLPPAQVAPAGREAQGRITAQVDEKKPAASAPDKLTLSKGSVQGKAAEDQIARERAAQDTATRIAELNRNIAELNRLTGTAPPAGGGSATGPAAGAPGSAAAAAPAPGASSGPGFNAPVGAIGAVPAARPAAGSTASTAPATAAPAAPAIQPPAPAPAGSTAASAGSTAASAAGSTPGAAQPAAGAASAPAAGSGTAPEATSSAAPAPALASTPAPAEPVPPASPVSATPAAPAVAPAAPAVAAAAAPAAEGPSLVDELVENPMVPVGLAGLLVAGLLGFGLFKYRQRRKATQVDSSFLESRLQPDSFFGASGGQRVDTAEGAATGSSMVYSPSQLDAAGDVDPVAEADVYLAYGRDLQAEEILKEALRISPQRVTIHAKLLEIYAKRRDARSFEQVASEAFSLTGGTGPEWEHICEMGQGLDAANPLYRPGGHPLSAGATQPMALAGVGVGAGAGALAATGAFAAPVRQDDAEQATDRQMLAETPDAASGVDLDLDLDFSLGDDEPAIGAAPTVQPPASVAAPELQGLDAPLDMDFGMGTLTAAPAPEPEPLAALELPAVDLPPATRAAAAGSGLPENSLDFDAHTLDFDAPAAAAPAPASVTAAAAPGPVTASPAPAADSGMIEFDLGALSLDLDSDKKADAGDAESPTSTAGMALGGGEEDDSLATKLALAEEFNAIGDPDGARSLAEEVLAAARGDLKNRAQRLLAEIG